MFVTRYSLFVTRYSLFVTEPNSQSSMLLYRHEFDFMIKRKKIFLRSITPVHEKINFRHFSGLSGLGDNDEKDY